MKRRTRRSQRLRLQKPYQPQLGASKTIPSMLGFLHRLMHTMYRTGQVFDLSESSSFALERHLRREEVIHPRKPVGVFRGEQVFPRSSVVVCKSAETYMREGRRIKGGQEALKLVKPRTVTINRKREEELLKMEGQEVALQGLFAEWQTELLIPPPIVNVSIFLCKIERRFLNATRQSKLSFLSPFSNKGIIPRNGYGNFDLFAPHMLPQGAKHLPCLSSSFAFISHRSSSTNWMPASFVLSRPVT